MPVQKIGKTVLIAEDDVPTLAALLEELELEGFDTLSAKDGREGLAKAIAKHPDLVILDIVMPKMSGMIVMKKIRETPWGAKVPIILLTRLSPTDKIMRGIHECEPSYYLMKEDWTLKDVAQKVREVLRV